MNRENIYFSHDANAMNDPKCMMLIEQLGMEGYGIFWGLVESLRQQPEFRMPLVLIPALASRFRSSEAKVKTVVTAFGLFSIERDEFFFSKSLRERMELMIEKRERRKKAGILSGEARRMKALCGSNEQCSNNVQAMFKQCSNNTEHCLNNTEQRKEIDLSNTDVLSKSLVSDSNNCSYSDKDSLKKEKESKKKKKSESRDSSVSKNKFFSPPSISEIGLYCKKRNNAIDPEMFFDFYQSKNWMVGSTKMSDWKASVRTWEKRRKNEKGQQDAKRYEEL